MLDDGVHYRKKALYSIVRLTETEIRGDEKVGNPQEVQAAVIGNICYFHSSLSCPEMDISPLFSPSVGCIHFNLFLQSIGVKSNKVISSQLIFRE